MCQQYFSNMYIVAVSFIGEVTRVAGENHRPVTRTILQARIQGAHPVRPLPLKLEKSMICMRKIVIFHTKYPKNFKCAPPPPNLKSWIRACIV